MTSKSLLALLGLLFVFTACNKSDDDPEQTPVPVPLIKTITYYQGNEVARYFSYEYDSLGRCSKMSLGFQPTVVSSYDTYRYSGDLVIVNRFSNGADTHKPDTLHLNKQGLVSWSSRNNYTREYDRNGYLIQSKTVNNVTTPLLITCQVSNGNFVKIIQTEGTTDQKVNTSTYVHIPNSVNTIGSENRGMVFYGKQDKNLIKEVHTVSSQWPSESTSYEYEYDVKNRVIKKTYTGHNSQMSEIFTYYN